ncbi:caspase domain-containing protein [Vararia minispora EC-137]|uniref:Caspase domain-containing protein n=1 Tax=Vararia minispora EC-137 TaxID=1314806 RepID=A0ACB8QBF7_9AGAM|nr:caspase domain-containing protein [Vararia minispora EC-137]
MDLENEEIVDGVNDASLGIHALLIGIDSYQSKGMYQLFGAVADAQSMYEFLTKELLTPTKNITVLLNAQATHDRILRCIDKLGSSSRVKRDDPILIYFAGHGSTIPTLRDWPVPSVQAILPYDARNEKGHVQNAIADMVLGDHIHRLADKVGNNITLVLDCCHSASGARADLDREGARHHSFGEAVLSDVYQSQYPLQNNRGLMDPSTFAAAGYRSYTLLAACGKDELAREMNNRGAFTSALLTLLNEVGTQSHTCAQIIHSLGRLRNQTPQCEGANANLTIFKASIDYRPHWHPVSPTDQRNEYKLGDAGVLQGITVGSKFDLYDSRRRLERAAPLGLLTVTQVNAINCLCTLSSSFGVSIPASAMALKRKHGPDSAPDNVLHVYVAPGSIPVFLDEAIGQAEEAQADAARGWRIKRTTLPDEAHIGIDYKNGEIAFTIHDEEILRLSKTRHARLGFSVPATATHITPVLRAAAHFFWHLRRLKRAIPGVDASLSECVKLHVYKLKESRLHNKVKKYVPAEPEKDLVPHDGSAWSVSVDGFSAHYGVELENTAEKLDLFHSMFYFDCSTLEISLLANSRSATFETIADAPLKAKGTCALNYHEGNGQQLLFALPAHQQVDFGYVVVFLSSRQFDLSHIEQNGFGPTVENPPKKWFTRLGRGLGIRGIVRANPPGDSQEAPTMEQPEKCGVLILPVLIEGRRARSVM